MPTLLVIESSPRGAHSMSRGLTQRFVEAWVGNNPDGRVVERDLMKTDLAFVSMPRLAAYFAPADKQTPEMKEILRLSDELVAELLAADVIAIGTPVYNYNIPAVLKAYIDHIVRKGLTLGFSGEGLVHGKTCTILMASGPDRGSCVWLRSRRPRLRASTQRHPFRQARRKHGSTLSGRWSSSIRLGAG